MIPCLPPTFWNRPFALAPVGRTWALGGGQIDLEFEKPAEDWTRKYWHLLGQRQFSKILWSNLTDGYQTIPYGGGLCIRKDLADSYVAATAREPYRLQLGRRGMVQYAYEDADLAYHVCDQGMGTGIFPELRVTHLIPPSRLTEEFLLRRLRDMAYSAVVFRAQRGGKISPSRPGLVDRLLKQYARLRMAPRERRFYDAGESARQAAIQHVLRADIQGGFPCEKVESPAATGL